MALSSKTLFQFTTKRDTLEEILKSKFLWPRYCTEYFWGKYRFAFPMMCLCDIPLSEINTHIMHYGNYGIGMSKEWASKLKELSSVIYTRRDTYLYKNVISILKRHEKGEELSSEEIFLLSRAKKYSGNTYCSPNGKRVLTSKVRFYDEREWRFVPRSLSSSDIFVEKNQEINPIPGDNDKTRGNPKFEYDDIKYLIVKNDSERVNLIKFIDKKLMTIVNKAEMTLLKSKILTVKQIKEDF
jgi:hypothetical protein